MAKLFWLQPDSSIIEFPLKAEQNLIGRTSRCDVRIKHPGISAEHAVIRVLPGSATVEDLGSTNGTRVNGKRVELHTLRHGDQIGVGRERLMYFAELDDAAKFIQPDSIEPFALPAAGGETVNTGAIGRAAPLTNAASALSSSAAPLAGESNLLKRAVPPTARPATAKSKGDGNFLEPDLDPDLLAALPTGASLANSPASEKEVAIATVRTPSAVAPPVEVSTAPATDAQPGTTERLLASVAVLTGVAAGKRFPLNQPSVTLGKEGKQVVEFLRSGPTRWQIRQREGVTPAYINGDALAGLHDLAAGDVIELTGVRLRFEIALNRP